MNNRFEANTNYTNAEANLGGIRVRLIFAAESDPYIPTLVREVLKQGYLDRTKENHKV